MLWPLHITLVCQPRLTHLIRESSATVYDDNINVQIDTSTLFPGDAHFCTVVKVSLNQLIIINRIILQHPDNVKNVLLTCNVVCDDNNIWFETATCKQLTPGLLNRLIRIVDSITAH